MAAHRSKRRAPEEEIQSSTGFDADNCGEIKDSRVAQDYAAARDAGAHVDHRVGAR